MDETQEDERSDAELDELSSRQPSVKNGFNKKPAAGKGLGQNKNLRNTYRESKDGKTF
jgi:hypothetical protein